MNALIEIQPLAIHGETTQTVNARELHAFLDVRRDFSSWIKGRIRDYEFQEGIDYISQVIDFNAPQNGGAPESTTYGQGRIEYHLTLEMAKELAMVERNEKGRQARKYFIECERRLQEQQKPAVPDASPLAALKHIVQTLEEQQTDIDWLKAGHRRHDVEIAQLRAQRGQRPRHLALVGGNQVGLDLDPAPEPKPEPKGGTHASPVPHERRGHYRQYPNGKRVWVRPSRVGKNQAH